MIAARLAIKLVLPVVFFGYAAFANLDLLREGSVSLSGRDLLRGGVTGEIDTLYRDRLPHRETSVGLVGAMRYALLGEGRDGVTVGRGNWLFTSEEYRFSDAAPVGMEETVARIAGLGADLARSGSRLVVLPLPAKVDIERRHGRNGAVAARSAAEYEAFLGALQTAGLAAVDTRPAFAGAGRSDRFFRTDTHWTPATAERVAARLAGSALIAPGETMFSKNLEPEVVFNGDLVSFVTSEALAPVVGLAPERAVPFLAQEAGDGTGALDLFGGGAGPAVVLVGTSYSANPVWSFAEALKIALRRDVLNFAEEGQGPVRPMQAFLTRGRQRLEAPADVVIWEFPIRYLADPGLWSAAEAEAGPDV